MSFSSFSKYAKSEIYVCREFNYQFYCNDVTVTSCTNINYNDVAVESVP